jgi:diguanylate cyclase (GGDEF)-like protein
MRSSASTAAEKPPRLVIRFAVFTALGLALAAVAIAFLVRSGSTAQAQRHAIERARFATEAVLARELRPPDLTARPSPARRRELGRLFREGVLLEGILGVALYDASGRLTFAAGPGASRTLPTERVREALRGVAISTVDPAGADERELRTFVPLVLGSSKTAGIAVFEQDYGPIQAAGTRSAWLAAGVLEGLLLLLFILLAPMLVRVSRRIRGQIAEIEHAATHDEPTGTGNRIRLRRAVEEALASGAPGALLVVDIDGFSELNEIFGSDGGDTVLREVALRLRWELADCELVARLGDDEFGVLLDSARPDVIEGVATRIRSSLATPVVVDTVRVAVTVSMGAAPLEEQEEQGDFVSLIRRAGAALSVAKEAGDGEVRIYEPGHEAREASRAALLAELREGLEKEELLVYFQPQVDLVTRQVRGVETLLRWQHPERGLLAAGEFIHEAERSGLAKEFRCFVLESSARCWRGWNELGLTLEISVNLGPVDLLDTSLPNEVAVLLETYGIPPWNLILEITERTLVVDERRTHEVTTALRELGVRLAVDDFGAGYSSLASLQRFPIQIVKLDRSLLANASAEPAANAILRGSIELAHAIGATVVAEGVETREQWDLVHALGCDIAQGYLLGHPAPAGEIELLLQTAPAVTREAA